MNRTLQCGRYLSAMAVRKQKFDYFMVLDFEATCNQGKKPDPQEIIEFPCLKVNTETLEIESKFHQYVRPVFHPQLSDFCTELTGIIQQMVDMEPNFTETLEMFDSWLKTENLADNNFVFITCGDWDLKSMLPRQCQSSKVPVPQYFEQWANLKNCYCDVTKTFPRGMMHMIRDLGMTHQGRHHSGIDDCMNIYEILKLLTASGCSPEILQQFLVKCKKLEVLVFDLPVSPWAVDLGTVLNNKALNVLHLVLDEYPVEHLSAAFQSLAPNKLQECHIDIREPLDLVQLISELPPGLWSALNELNLYINAYNDAQLGLFEIVTHMPVLHHCSILLGDDVIVTFVEFAHEVKSLFSGRQTQQQQLEVYFLNDGRMETTGCNVIQLFRPRAAAALSHHQFWRGRYS